MTTALTYKEIADRYRALPTLTLKNFYVFDAASYESPDEDYLTAIPVISIVSGTLFGFDVENRILKSLERQIIEQIFFERQLLGLGAGK